MERRQAPTCSAPGIIYVVLFLYGVLVGAGSDANFVPANNADDWLHLVLAIGLLASWYVSRGDRGLAPATP